MGALLLFETGNVQFGEMGVVWLSEVGVVWLTEVGEVQYSLNRNSVVESDGRRTFAWDGYCPVVWDGS